MSTSGRLSAHFILLAILNFVTEALMPNLTAMYDKTWLIIGPDLHGSLTQPYLLPIVVSMILPTVRYSTYCT